MENLYFRGMCDAEDEKEAAACEFYTEHAFDSQRIFRIDEGNNDQVFVHCFFRKQHDGSCMNVNAKEDREGKVPPDHARTFLNSLKAIFSHSIDKEIERLAAEFDIVEPEEKQIFRRSAWEAVKLAVIDKQN